MAQLPRDPRQLARDILSGKVKLEDLAREKARQQMPGQMPGNIQPTARVPSPRPPPPLPAQRRPIQTAPPRPPAFPQQRPVQQPARIPPPAPARQQFPQRAPQQPAVRRGPNIQPPPRVKTESMASRTAAADRQEVQDIKEAKIAAIRATPLNSGRAAIRQMLRNRQSVRTGILMSEILGPCKALRD